VLKKFGKNYFFGKSKNISYLNENYVSQIKMGFFDMALPHNDYIQHNESTLYKHKFNY
jgi:hypothetical protein